MKTRQENDYYKSSNKQIPNKVDWRQLGYVTPVKDQAKVHGLSLQLQL